MEVLTDDGLVEVLTTELVAEAGYGKKVLGGMEVKEPRG